MKFQVDYLCIKKNDDISIYIDNHRLIISV